MYLAAIFRLPLPLVLANMPAQIFLCLFACIYERTCVCRTVSVHETCTAVCEWACCIYPHRHRNKTYMSPITPMAHEKYKALRRVTLKISYTYSLRKIIKNNINVFLYFSFF